jgi:hypothetical protein
VRLRAERLPEDATPEAQEFLVNDALARALSPGGPVLDRDLRIAGYRGRVVGVIDDPGPDETMATVFHLDGGRLMATHDCVAKNQPRLVATAISRDGRRIELAFLDGTNMASRDTGHMDRAVFVIESADRYRSRWTFYRDGQAQWLEDIVNTRRREPENLRQAKIEHLHGAVVPHFDIGRLQIAMQDALAVRGFQRPRD